MTFWQSIIFSLVQGIAEFLPISSSGHLNLIHFLYQLKPSVNFDVFLNTASLISVLLYFRHQKAYFYHNFKYILLASLPAALVGLLFRRQIGIVYENRFLLPFFFLITSLLVYSTRFSKNQENKMSLAKALLIGSFQALAILPGVSRSGATISAAMLLGISPLAAFNFSFALYLPASIGALILEAYKLPISEINQYFSPVYLLSFVLTIIVSYTALFTLQKILSRRSIWYFSIYTSLLAFLLLIFSSQLLFR